MRILSEINFFFQNFSFFTEDIHIAEFRHFELILSVLVFPVGNHLNYNHFIVFGIKRHFPESVK